MVEKESSQLDQPAVLRVLFHPRPDFSSNDEKDVYFSMADGVRIGGRLHLVGASAPLILLFHGNGEIASDYDLIGPLYQEIGASLLVSDYRGYGKSGGTPSSSALLADALEVFRSLGSVLPERGVKPSRVFIMGRSLGSAAAIEIAAEVGDSIGGLIIESGFADTLGLIERIGGPSLAHLGEEACGFNNPGKLERVEVPILIIHGEEDFIIPFEEGETLFRRCRSERKEFLPIVGAGHNDLLFRGRREYFQAIGNLLLG